MLFSYKRKNCGDIDNCNKTFLLQLRGSPKRTEISVLQVLQMPRVKESPPKLLHSGNIFKQVKYLWVTGPLMGLSTWIPLRSVMNTDLWDSGGGWAMPALCTPPTW